jgi:hypothetical protein
MRLQARRGVKYDIVRIGEVDGLTLIPSLYNIEEIRKLGVEYLVASSLSYNWFAGVKGRQRYPVHADFYEDLFKMKPVKIFEPVNQPGPVIRIYKLL